jgi:hypothetical protein
MKKRDQKSEWTTKESVRLLRRPVLDKTVSGGERDLSSYNGLISYFVTGQLLGNYAVWFSELGF